MSAWVSDAADALTDLRAKEQNLIRNRAACGLLAKSKPARVAARAPWLPGAVDALRKQQRLAAARVHDKNRKNVTERRAWSKAWQAKNADRFLASVRDWQSRNRDKVRVYARLSLGRRRDTIGADRVSAVQWQEILETFGHRCAYCLCAPEKLTMDHVTPLKKGGRHDVDNLVPACLSCNVRKNARGPLATLNR